MIWLNVQLVIYIVGSLTNSFFYFIGKIDLNLFRNCVRTHIDVCFKEGKCRFACVENCCPGEYTMRLVSELLLPKDLKRLNRRIQEENIRQGNMNRLDLDLIDWKFLLAEIDGLECCPYCPYAVIVDNPDDKIFRCLNPECMKETCR